jgi:hypothetical protein
MAEQKTDETKPAVPRRGARPFIGPAGTGAAARPLLRPTAAPDRPRPAAFAPPSVARTEQPSLGVAATASQADEPAAPVLVDAAPSFDVATPEPQTTASVQVAVASDALPDIAPSIPARSTDEPEFYAGHDDLTPPPAMPGRPVTSEMVAIDAVDAFDAVWSAAASGVAGAPPAAQDVSSPLDELSLGGGLDGPHLWTDEITVPLDQLAAVSEPESERAEDTVETVVESPDAIADLSMPSWLGDEPGLEAVAVGHLGDVGPTITLADDASSDGDTSLSADVVEDTSWPDPLLAEYAPYIPTPSSISAIIPAAEELAASIPATIESAVVDGSIHDDAELSICEPTVHRPHAEAADATKEAIMADAIPAWMHDAAAVQLDARPEPTAHVSAALARLAERVRSGEIDVSSVAAEATDAAVLASVLAALLGGSSSR